MDFGQPNVEIGQKMANGQLLFLALKDTTIDYYTDLLQGQSPVQQHHQVHCSSDQDRSDGDYPKSKNKSSSASVGTHSSGKLCIHMHTCLYTC